MDNLTDRLRALKALLDVVTALVRLVGKLFPRKMRHTTNGHRNGSGKRD
jgi:hypothetical protein